MVSKLEPAHENADSPVLVAGGTGYVGSALVQKLKGKGHNVIVLSRTGGRSLHGAPVLAYSDLGDIHHARGIINLAGAGIADQRWTATRKRELRSSRLETTWQLCRWAQQQAKAPDFFINASAIGYYGNTGELAVDEAGTPGSGFGAQLCRDWEGALQLPAVTRTCILRIGVVLGRNGGALQRMLPAFRFGLGGSLGSGEQWMSWISLQDLIELITRCVTETEWNGVYNAVAPQPVRNDEFAKTLGKALNRPTLFSTPAWTLKLALGEMSSLLLESQRITSSRLQSAGFTFTHRSLDSALRSAVAGASDDS